MIKVGIVGGAGYAGVELLRILSHHPNTLLVAITSRTEAGAFPSRPHPGHAWLLRYCRPARVHTIGRGRRCTSTAFDRRCQVGSQWRRPQARVHILFSKAADNFKACGVAGHRHLPEILQGLVRAAGHEVGVTFIPHLTPMIRGIHATLYGRLIQEVDVQSLYERRFAAEPFVDVLAAGSHPDTRWVRGANHCRMAVHRPGGGDTLVVLAVIDNLVKGIAGQAVQNMNIVFGLAETTGLEMLALP
jgi:N-acetyl-gamma-glutamylphosphate reductase